MTDNGSHTVRERILPAVSWAYPHSDVKNRDIFPFITGGRQCVFQGNLTHNLQAFDQTQMYPFLKL
jgi:hypothetical protein